MARRTGTITRVELDYPTVEAVKLGTLYATVGGFVWARPLGLPEPREAACRVLRIRVDDDGQPVEFHLGVVARRSGQPHPHQGVYRTVTPDRVRPMRTQPTAIRQENRTILSWED